MFGPDIIELKPMESFHISNPSPSFRNVNNLDELIVVGTHLRLIPTSNENSLWDKQRKRSE